MFSSDENSTQEDATGDLGLDGLQLDMDYDQIMHYFDNLKVCKYLFYYEFFVVKML